MEDQQNSMTPKQQTVDRLKNCVSVVVTLGNQPSADEYASAIGLVQILRRFGKKASVITNTPLPKPLTFLSPGEAVTGKLDHLRDFVIELDKDKADKLRYEPSDTNVKIFITPYKQEITQADLRFSQGNYNVDTVIVIGASGKDALDGALKEHGKLLQDALIITLSAGEKLSSFGAINWQEPTASTVAEMLVSVADALQNGLLDQGTAQVLLSALVAATDRFHNHKTTAKVMTIAAQLIAAGADPQIVMSQFDGTPLSKPASPAKKPAQAAPTPPPVPAAPSRSLDIPHELKGSPNKSSDSNTNQKPAQKPTPAPLAAPVSTPVPLPPASPAITLSPAVSQPLPPEQTVHTSGTDNQLTGDAIDALMQGIDQTTNEFDAQPALGASASTIPLMQHQNSLVPPAMPASPLPPQPLPAMQPAAPSFGLPPNPAPLPAQPYNPPVPQVLPASLPAAPAEPAADDSSIDAARQAVEQAVSQLSPAAPTGTPSAAVASPDIYVAPDGTLQYAAPQSAPPTV